MKYKMPRTIIVILCTIFVLGIIVYGSFDPEKTNFFPRCPIFTLTGLKCPGCGSQRALHQLLHLNIIEALKYNALMIFSIILLAFITISTLFKERAPKLYTFSRSPLFGSIIVIMILLWCILRNIFPNIL